MKGFVKFLGEIGPELFQLGQALFDRHKGDASAARRDLQSRTADIRQRRARRDTQLDEKHGRR